MAWTAYASSSSLIKNSGQLLSAETTSGNGLWLSDRAITDSSIPSLSSNKGILLDLESCFDLGHNVSGGTYRSPQSQCLNYPIGTNYFWGSVYDGWEHDSSRPWIGLADIRIILSKSKGGTSGLTYSSIMSNSVYLTAVFNGVINDTIVSSAQSNNQNDGYPLLYVSGAYNTFPDYRYTGGVNESYCYGPTLYNISSYTDINNYLSQGYEYAGVHIALKRQQFYFNAGGPGSGNYYMWGTALAPNNTYCTASYSSNFDGSKVRTGNAWQNIKGGYVYVEGVWKPITGMKVYVGGEWKEVPQTKTITWATK